MDCFLAPLILLEQANILQFIRMTAGYPKNDNKWSGFWSSHLSARKCGPDPLVTTFVLSNQHCFSLPASEVIYYLKPYFLSAKQKNLFEYRITYYPLCRSDDQLEVQDISDSEASSSAVLPSFSRIQSRLNPVPESLNSPDIAPGTLRHSEGLFSASLSGTCISLFSMDCELIKAIRNQI